ncbi:MAG: hypothetical protein ACTSVB_10520, partial [Candidatus Heimdallarchaeaceae archaeon]
YSSVQEAYSDGHEDFDDGYFIIAVPSLTDSGDYDWYVSLDYVHYFNGKKTKLSDFEALAFWEMIVNTFCVTALLADIRDFICAPDAFIRVMAMMQIPMDIISIICFFSPIPKKSLESKFLNSMGKTSKFSVKTTKGFMKFVSNIGEFAEKRLVKFIVKRNKFHLLLEFGGKLGTTLKILTVIQTFLEFTVCLPQKLALLFHTLPLNMAVKTGFRGIHFINNGLIKLYETANDMDIVANFMLRKWLYKHGQINSFDLLKNSLDFRATSTLSSTGITSLVQYSSLKYLSLSYATALNSNNEGNYPIFTIKNGKTAIDDYYYFNGEKIEPSKINLRRNYELIKRMDALEALHREGIFLVRNNQMDIEETRNNIISLIRRSNPFLSQEELARLVAEELEAILYKHYGAPNHYIFYLELPKYLGNLMTKEDVHKFFEQDLDFKFLDWLKEQGYSGSYLSSVFDPREDFTSSYSKKSFVRSAIPLFFILQRIFFYSEFAKHMFNIMKEKNDGLSTRECAIKVLYNLKSLLRKIDKTIYESFDGSNFFLKIKSNLKEGENDPFEVNIKDYILKSTIELLPADNIRIASTSGIDLFIGNGILYELKTESGIPGYAHVYNKADSLKFFETGLYDDFVYDYDTSTNKIVKLSEIYAAFPVNEEYFPNRFSSSTGLLSTLLAGAGALFTGQSTKLTIEEMAKILLGYKLIFHAATGYSTNFGLFEIKDEKNKIYNPAEEYVNIKRIDVENNKEEYLKIKIHRTLTVINKEKLNEKFKQDFGEEAQAYYTAQSNKYGHHVIIYSAKTKEFFVSLLDNFNTKYAQEGSSAKILALHYIPTKYPLYQIQVERVSKFTCKIVSVTTKELVDKLYSPKGEETLIENGIGLNSWSRIRVISENNKLIPVLILQDKDGNIIKDKKGKTIYWKLFSPLNYDKYTEFEGTEDQIVSFKDKLNDVSNAKNSNLKMIRMIAQELNIPVKQVWDFISDSALKFSKYLRNRNVLAFEIDNNQKGKIMIDKNHMTIDDAIIEIDNYLDIIVKEENTVKEENLLNDEYTIIEKIKNFYFSAETKLTDKIIAELANILTEYKEELERLKEMTTLFNPKERVNKLIYTLSGVSFVDYRTISYSPEKIEEKLDNTLNALGYLVAFLKQEQGGLKEEEINALKNGRKEYRYQVDIIEEFMLKNGEDTLKALERKENERKTISIIDLANLLENVDNIMLNENVKLMFGKYKGEKGQLKR